MLKALGIILIVFACGMYIVAKVTISKEKLQNLREIKKAIKYLKHELAFCVSEIGPLCNMAAQRTQGEISATLNKMSELLNKDDRIDFCMAWRIAKNEKTLFSPQADEIVTELFSEFGKKSLDIELDNIKRVQIQLDELEKDEEKKHQGDRRLICTLGAAFCATIVILAI